MRTSIRSDSDPTNRAFVITPSDTINVAFPGCKLYVGSTGNVKVALHSQATGVAADVVTFIDVPVGFMPVLVSRVYATGTTASEILGVWNDR